MIEDDESRVGVFQAWLDRTKLDRQVRIVWAKSAGSAIGLLQRDQGNVYAGIMLDHDLDLQNLTSWDGLYSGRDVAQKIIAVVDRDVPIIVHSTNTTGGPKLRDELDAAGFSVMLMPIYAFSLPKYREWLRYVCDLRD